MTGRGAWCTVAPVLFAVTSLTGTTVAQPIATAAPAVVTTAAVTTQRLRPPVVSSDFPDPALLWGGDAFYAFSTNVGFFNVPVMHSRNLFDWSAPLDAVPVLPPWAVGGRTWAPAAAFIGGQYVLYISAIQGFSGAHCVDRLVSPSPAGPFAALPDATGPLFCNEVGGTGAIDPQPIVEPDGSVFLDWKAEGTRGQQIWAVALTPDGLQLAGPSHALLTATASWEAGGVENPAMVLAGGQHVLLYSGNYWAGGSYAIGYATCDGPLGPCHKQTVSGPWVSSENSASGPGGASFATGPDGQVWMAVHGWTSGAVGYRNDGRRQLHVEPVSFGGDGPALVNRAPSGTFDLASRSPGGIAVGGWAVDPDTGAPITVDLQLNGRDVGDLAGAANRPDVGASQPQAGPDHGFGSTLGVADGTHVVCVTAVDDLGAATTPLGCATVTVTSEPIGAMDAAVATAGGLRASGWAIDPDTGSAIDVHFYVDGHFYGITTANADRADLAQAYPGYGPSHGWTADLALPPGIHQVCTYAIDSGDEPSVPLGCAGVQVGS